MIIKVNDIVRLKPNGQGGTYSTFTGMVDLMVKKDKIVKNKWHKGNLPPYETRFIVRAIKQRNIDWGNEWIAYIESLVDGKGYLIDTEKLNLLERHNTDFIKPDEMKI